MKKPFLFFLAICVASFSCNFNNAPSSEDHQGKTMKLNQGQKWGANIETTQGILNMQNLLATSKAETIEDYEKLYTSLNKEKNDLIKKCTMTGAAHDNLHIFLEPLLGQIHSLEKVKSVEEGDKITRKMAKHLEIYSQYFQ